MNTIITAIEQNAVALFAELCSGLIEDRDLTEGVQRPLEEARALVQGTLPLGFRGIVSRAETELDIARWATYDFSGVGSHRTPWGRCMAWAEAEAAAGLVTLGQDIVHPHPTYYEGSSYRQEAVDAWRNGREMMACIYYGKGRRGGDFIHVTSDGKVTASVPGRDSYGNPEGTSFVDMTSEWTRRYGEFGGGTGASE